jgi:glycosyltransferase involved in cell wall biosynthesis
LTAKAVEGGAAALELSKSTPELSRRTPPEAVALPRILISNGFSRFPMAQLAAGLRQREWDVQLLTGAYPSGVTATIMRALPHRWSYRLGRLQDRQVRIESNRVHAGLASEVVQRTGQILGSKGAVRLGAALEVAGFRLVGLQAARTVRRMPHLAAYHYRSGFGLESVDAARRRGVLTICDHSIAHPATLEPLMENGGRLPADWRPSRPRGMWRLVLRDIEGADWILVNSDFVRTTFEWAGFDTTRVKVVYAGVEADFMNAIPERGSDADVGPLHLLFAGEIGHRKGADVLFRALSTLNGFDWKLDLIGEVTPAIAEGWSKFLNDPRVTWHGTVRIRRLAALMSEAEVFVFPSLAEGSARVVAMAMAAGCYVVTTPNSGSVVRDGIHGRLVPPGDDDALAATLTEIADRRATLLPIGRSNAHLIRSEYLVEHYVERVISFYNQILQPDGPLP